jgi:hypothetical protein
MTLFARRIPLAGAAMLAAAGTLVAQSYTGNVQGRLIDEHGSPIADGTVTLQGPSAPQRAGVDAQGQFRFFQVPSGTYSVTAAAPGFATVTREAVLVSVGRLTALEISLRVSDVNEAVTVQGEPPLIDPGRVATGQTFAREQLTEIPTARDAWSLVQQVPGIQLDTVNVAGNANATLGGPSFSNRGSGNVIYAVDGATLTDSFYGFALDRQNGGTSAFLDFGAVEDVEVITGGSSLDQQTSGVTINVVTKRGTNNLKGSARFLYASANWQSDNTPAASSALGLQTNQTRFIREYGGEIGGPLVEDRLWLWASGARQDISLSTTTIFEDEKPLTETTTLVPWNAKLNAQLSGANALTLAYQRSDRLAWGIEALPDRPYETRLNLLVPSDFYRMEDSHVFSSDLFASLFVAYQEPRFESLPIGGLDRDMEFYDGQYHATYEYKISKQPQRQANLQVSRFFRTGPAGHELKFGFNYRQQIIDSSTGLPGSQNFGDPRFSPAVANLTRGVRLTFRNEYWTGTLGDTVSAGNLTLSAGLRFDLQRGRNLPSRSFANGTFAEPCPDCGEGGFPGLPEVRYGGADDWQIEFVDWQPRVSATYAIGQSKATLLRATYARYVDQLGYLTAFVNGTPGQNGYRYGWSDLNGDHLVERGEVDWDVYLGFLNFLDPASLPGSPNQVAPDLETPATDEVTLGVDRELGENLAVSGTFAYRNTTRLQASLPIGAGPTTWRPGGRATGTVASPHGFTVTFDEPYYLLELPEPPTGEIAENRPGAAQRYFGVDVSIVKRLSKDWMLRANVGWSSFRQYLTPESIQNPNNLWARGGQNDDGGLATAVSTKDNVWLNAAWQFSLNGLYQGPWGLMLGANLYGRQGYPRPFKVEVYNTGDVANNTWNLLIDDVDTYRYPNLYQLDLRLQKTLQIGPLTVTPAVELFNAANSNTLLNSYPVAGYYDGADGTFYPEPFFDATIEIQSPRIVRLGVQVSF